MYRPISASQVLEVTKCHRTLLPRGPCWRWKTGLLLGGYLGTAEGKSMALKTSGCLCTGLWFLHLTAKFIVSRFKIPGCSLGNLILRAAIQLTQVVTKSLAEPDHAEIHCFKSWLCTWNSQSTSFHHRLSWNWTSSCLSLLSAGITNSHYHFTFEYDQIEKDF